MKKLLYLFLALGLMMLTAGCTHTSREPRLVAVDSMLATRPDSALALLRQDFRSSFGEVEGSSEADRMYYYLLLADACNKCYDTLPSDSVMHLVADFYDAHGTPNEQVRAHYLLGCVYRDLGEAPQALDCYHTALDRADTTASDCNYRLLMSVYGQMADLFHKQNLPQDEIWALELSGKCNLAYDDTIGYVRSEELKIKPYGLMQDTTKVLETIERTKRLYIEYGYPYLALRENIILIHYCVEKGELEKAQALMQEYERDSKLFDDQGNIAKEREAYYYIKGSYFIKMNQLDSAEYHMRRLLIKDNEADAYRGLLTVYQQKKNTDSIIKYARLYEDALDMLNNQLRTEVVEQMSSMYNYQRYQQIAERESRAAEKAKARGLAILLVSILIIASGIYTYFRYKKKKKAEIRQLNNCYIQALVQYNNLSVELERLRQKDDQLISEKQQEVNDLRVVIDRYQSQLQRNNTGRQLTEFKDSKMVSYFKNKAKYTYKTVPPLESDWGILVKDFSKYVPSAFAAIGGSSVLSQNELRICIILLSGFKTADAAILLNCSVQSITNIKARANYKLFGANSAASLEKNLMKIVGMV